MYSYIWLFSISDTLERLPVKLKTKMVGTGIVGTHHSKEQSAQPPLVQEWPTLSRWVPASRISGFPNKGGYPSGASTRAPCVNVSAHRSYVAGAGTMLV